MTCPFCHRDVPKEQLKSGRCPHCGTSVPTVHLQRRWQPVPMIDHSQRRGREGRLKRRRDD